MLLSAKKSIEIGLEVSDVKDISPEFLKRWNYSENTEGVIITSIKIGSTADRAGLKPGMLLMQINGKKIKNAEDFSEAMTHIDNKKHLLFLVRFQNITRFITIKTK
jgi:S1-C subfamily serine protease